MLTAKTVTKTRWASVRTEDAFVGRIIQNYQPRVREYERDNRGEIIPELWSDVWTGLLVPATIIEIGTHGTGAANCTVKAGILSGFNSRFRQRTPTRYLYERHRIPTRLDPAACTLPNWASTRSRSATALTRDRSCRCGRPARRTGPWWCGKWTATAWTRPKSGPSVWQPSTSRRSPRRGIGVCSRMGEGSAIKSP